MPLYKASRGGHVVRAETKEPRADFARLRRDLVIIKWMTVLALAGVILLVLKAYFPG